MKRRSNTIINKIRSNAAFTLAEALVAIIILLLVSGIVAAGIPAAARAYDNVVVAANSEMLLSTAMSELRNELGTAKEISTSVLVREDGVDKEKKITYYNESAGSFSAITIYNEKENKNYDDIQYQRYAADGFIIKPEEVKAGGANSDGYGISEKLISDLASDKDKGLHVIYDAVSYDPDKGIVTFTGLKVLRNNGSETPVKRDKYLIRVITD